MREALKSLPWVDSDKPILADSTTRQAKFTVKKAADFDVNAIQKLLADAGFKEVTVVAGPKKS